MEILSTSLFIFRIEAVEGSSLKIKVFIVHPDVKNLPEHPKFVMSILLDCWRRMRKGHFFPEESHLPISLDEAREIAVNTPCIQDLHRLEHLSFGYREWISESDYQIILKTGMHLGNPTPSYGSERVDGKMQYYIAHPENPKAFHASVSTFIDRVSTQNLQNFSQSAYDLLIENDGDNMGRFKEQIPQGILHVRVKKPELLEFLKQSTEWESNILP